MARSISNRVLIPADLPNRSRVESVLRANGWQPCAYADDGEAEQYLAESPATAILLFGPAGAPRRADLVKKVRNVCPETVVMDFGGRQAGADTDTLLSETSTPEEIALAVRMGRILRQAEAERASLREQLQQLDAHAREQMERIRELETACNELRRAAEMAENLALHDELTGLYNRRYFMQALGQQLERARREESRLAVAMLDIDHFKQCNDTHGHLVGDRLLREIAQCIQRNLRRMDTLARYGGEEFVAILPETRMGRQGVFDPGLLVERVCKRVAGICFSASENQSVRVTLSAGVATFPCDGDSAEVLVRVADDRLYRAKRGGRNRVCASDQ